MFGHWFDYKYICSSLVFILSFLLKSLMSESNETTPLTPDWAQFYQQNVQPQHAIFSGATDRVSYATAVVAAAASPSAPSSAHRQPAATTSSGLSPELGRVAKPVRRRSRASRRTPTTVFNTDASNFRAMVQQFTGGGLTGLPPPPPHPLPSPFSIASGTGLGMGFAQQHLENLNVPPRAGYNMQFEQVQSQQPYSLASSSHGDHHLQAFLGRVSLNPPPPSGGGGGGSSSSSGNDQNRNETNYML